MNWIHELETILSLPRGQQAPRLATLRHQLPDRVIPEAWNTAFGSGSLFDAWTSSSLVRGLYAANRAVLSEMLQPGFTAVEVGGGDGRLWEGMDPGLVGELWVIDPVPHAHERVAEVVPAGVRVRPMVARVEDVALPEADVIVCSLTLHHVAGLDASERQRHRMSGPGKREVLSRMRSALPGGVLVLNEADVHCDLCLAPGTDALRDHIIDSYLRRAGRALIADIESCEDSDRRGRLEAVLRHWCLEQIDVVDAAIEDRDVYELDAAHWLELLDQAGFSDVAHRYTDQVHLFRQYVCR